MTLLITRGHKGWENWRNRGRVDESEALLVQTLLQSSGITIRFRLSIKPSLGPFAAILIQWHVAVILSVHMVVPTHMCTPPGMPPRPFSRLGIFGCCQPWPFWSADHSLCQVG